MASTVTSLGSFFRSASATYSTVGMKRQKTMGCDPRGDQLRSALDLGVAFPGEHGGIAREIAQPAPLRRGIVVVLAGAGHHVLALGALLVEVEHGAAPLLVDCLDRLGAGDACGCPRRRGFRAARAR